MANVGDQLLQPEQGWIRYDDSDSGIKVSDNWILYNKESYWNGRLLAKANPETQDFTIEFKFYGSGLRYIDTLGPGRGEMSILIDNVNEYKFTGGEYSQKDQGLCIDIQNLTKEVHTVFIKNISISGSNNSIGFDAVDIKDGYIFPELSKDYEFPVKTIEKADLEAYAASCANNEEQLLIAIEDGSQYLTRGDGTYIECNKGNSEGPKSKVLLEGNMENLAVYTMTNSVLDFSCILIQYGYKDDKTLISNVSSRLLTSKDIKTGQRIRLDYHSPSSNQSIKLIYVYCDTSIENEKITINSNQSTSSGTLSPYDNPKIVINKILGIY